MIQPGRATRPAEPTLPPEAESTAHRAGSPYRVFQRVESAHDLGDDVTLIPISRLFPASIAARLRVNHVASIPAILGKGVTSTLFD